MKIPKHYCIEEEDCAFALGEMPLYSVQIAEQLHPDPVEEGDDGELIETRMVNNPIPVDFTPASLNLLETISEYKGDDVLKLRPITLFLRRKWDRHAYKFFLLQFLSFITLLSSLIAYYTIPSDKYPIVRMVCFYIALMFNGYFLFYEGI